MTKLPAHIRINKIERIEVSCICDGCGAKCNFCTDDSKEANKGTRKFIRQHKKCKGVVGG